MSTSTTKDAGTPAGSNKASRTMLTIFNLTILTTVSVASLRSLPAMAGYGLGSVTLYIVPAIFFLVPTALVAAELATGWKGGVYIWVREAFGNRWGFQAIWLQWVQNVVWYPTQLAFVAASIAFMFLDPNAANSGVYTAILIIVLYWASTFLTLRGGNLFARVGSWGGIVGTIIPGALLIILGIVWIATGQKSEISLEPSNLIPPFTGLASIVLIVSNFLAYAGMEVNAVHANDMKDPGRQYPKAILVASVLILSVFILPTISIGLVVPNSELGLTNGVNLAFQAFFKAWGVSWATPILAALIAIGALASVVAWIAGPSRGLLTAARTGLLPPWLQKRNSAGVQQGILFTQGIIVTLLACIFLFDQNVSSAFFTLVDMAAALYLIMYMMMFAAAIRLRRIRPDVKRTYRVPAMGVIASVGFLASLAGFILGFVPPTGLSGISPGMYPVVMLVVIVILGGPPLLFYAMRKPQWDTRTPQEKEDTADILVNPKSASQPST